MQRRRYLIGMGTIAAISGCLAAPRAAEVDDDDDTGASDDGHDDAAAGYYANGDLTAYRHELGDWFELGDLRVRVSGSAREPAEDFDTTGDDIYLVRMRLENPTGEPVSLEHAPFWLEELGTSVPPDSTFSGQLENGARGEETVVDPDTQRRLTLAFPVPDEVEPAYLWVETHYICLV